MKNNFEKMIINLIGKNWSIDQIAKYIADRSAYSKKIVREKVIKKLKI